MKKNIIFTSFLGILFAGNLNALEYREGLNYINVNNSEVKKYRAEYLALEEKKNQAFALLLPSVRISVSRSKVDQERSDSGRTFPRQKYTTESDALILNQPIYRPKLMKDYQRSEFEVSSEKLLLTDRENTIKLKYSQVYLNLIGLLEEKLLIDEEVKLLEKQLLASQKSILAGTGTITEKAEIQAAIDRIRVQILGVIQKISMAKSELSIITGENVEYVQRLNEKTYEKFPFNLDNLANLKERAREQNIIISSIKSRISASQMRVSSEKYNRFPSLDLTMQVTKGSSESTFFVDTVTKSSLIGLTLSRPSYLGGSLGSRVRESVHLLDVEKENLRIEVDNLERELQEAYFSFQKSLDLNKALSTALSSSMTELDSNKKSVKAGVRRQLDVLVSQNKVRSIKKELINSKLNVLYNWLVIKRLTGELGEQDIQEISNLLL